MFARRFNYQRYAGIFTILLITTLVAITAIASPLESVNAYLPLVILQRPTPTPSATGLLLVSEVLYNPTSDVAAEPAGEWIEIYNPGPGPVILSAYKLGDETSQGGREGMLQFPAGTMLYPGEVIVVANKGAAFLNTYGFPPDYEMNDSHPDVPVMLKYREWSTGAVELVNQGDEILLLDGDDNFVDVVTWGDSDWSLAFDPPPPSVDDGQSLERSPAYIDSDTADDWVVAETPGPYQLDLSTPTPEIPTGPTILLISEVLYDPSGDDPAGEWIEIYNAGENNALLSDYRLGDEETQGQGEGMYSFPEGAVLFIEDIAIVSNRSIVFESIFGFKPDFEIYDTDSAVPNMIRDTNWSTGSMNLSTSGDDVILLDSNNVIVDGLSWGSSNAILNPSVPTAEPDHSLERYPATTDTNSAADWREQADPSPGELDLSTPTATPSPTATLIPEPLPDLIINEINADPDAMLGDANGDGSVDTTQDEFLEIVNTTENDIDIGGWQVHDLTGPRHIFTSTLVVPAGCAVVVFGGGTPVGDFGNAIVQISSTGTLGLNNSGDTITLYDKSFTAVNSYAYGSEGGDNQSLTRNPDINGPDPMIKHSQIPSANGALFSPGTRVDGSSFDGCAVSAWLNHTSDLKVP